MKRGFLWVCEGRQEVRDARYKFDEKLICFTFLKLISTKKMKTKLTLLMAAFACIVQANAQELNFSVKWGKELEAPRRSSLNDIVGYDASGIYAIKERLRGLGGDTDYTLEHYDDNFSLTKSFDLDLESGQEKGKMNNVLYLNKKLYLFYSVADQKTKKNSLFAKEVDKGTLEPKNETKKLGEIDYTGKRKKNSGTFSYRVSRDSSKLLIFYALPYDEDEPEAFGFNVLDNQLNSLWQKDITLPYKDELFDIESFRVDNAGNAYLLGLIYKDKRKSKRKGAPNYSYEIFACRDKGNTIKQYPISLDDRFLSDMQIEILDNQNLICAGFYSEKGTFSVRGTYFLVVDAATKAIKTKSFKEFGIDFITQNMTDREARKATRKEKRGEEVELYEYDLDKLLVGKDGSAILIGEQYFVHTVVTTMRMANGMTNTQTNYHYYYNDLIAMKINPKGEIEWAQKIAKTQHTVNDGGFYSSYALAIVKGKICFIFNDNPKNLEEDKKEGKAANYKASKSVVVIVSLDQKGNVTKQPIFNSVDVEVITRPKVCEQISNREVILFGQRKKNQQFARVTFN
jgi:hypothetical protein